MWQWQLPALIGHFSVLTYDLLGHGESASPEGVVGLATFSDQLLRVMDACALECAAIVGFSLGGMIARRFALDHPDRLWAMAVLHSPHDRTTSEREAVSQRARQARASGPSATVDAALDRWFTPAFRAERADVMDLVREWILANDPTVYPEVYRVLAEGDAELVDSIDRISCPTLIMTGGQDTGNSPEMARKMATRIPDARVEILPGLRHMGLAESPSAVNTPLLAFLLDVRNRRG